MLKPASTYIVILLTLFSLQGFSQNGYGEFNQEISKSTLKKARKSSENADFSEAIQRYRILLAKDPDNVIYNKELGMTFFDSPYQKVMSIPYLEKAIEKGKPEEMGELYYPLAVAYRMKGNYDKAREHFGNYLNQLKSFGTYLSQSDEKELTDEINREIEICNNAETFSSIPPLSFIKDSVSYVPKLERMPAPVNSIYDEYSPVFTHNDSTIIFTARRKGSKGGKVNWDGKFYEDIWVSDFNGQAWSEPRSLGDHINTSGHEAVNSISKDKKTLYLYRAVKNGSILESKLISQNHWGEPEKLGGTLNSKAWETSLGVTLYDSVVYFVSDRKGGYGGRDIYVSRKNKDGVWSDGANLGAAVNTPYEEDAPFLSADGKYLYFASTGHNTMGGFDLFRSSWNDNSWNKPENLGAPINTENHDIYLMFSADGEKGWISSQRITNDTLNDMNMYAVTFECRTIASTTLRGLALNKETGKGLQTKLYLTDMSTSVKDSVKSNADGTYMVKIIPEHTYEMVIAANGFQADTLSVNVPKQCKPYDLFQMMAVSNVKEGNRFTKQNIEVHNALFDIRTKSGSTGGKGLTDDLKNFITNSTDLEKNEGYTYVVLEKSLKEGDVISSTEETFVNILFDYDDARLKNDAKTTLDKVSQFMKKNPAADIELRGFADSTGTEEYNRKLSERRSEAARKYLIAKGIKKGRLITIGYGESEPVNDNSTEEGKQQNRRVEFKVYPKGQDEKSGKEDLK